MSKDEVGKAPDGGWNAQVARNVIARPYDERDEPSEARILAVAFQRQADELQRLRASLATAQAVQERETNGRIDALADVVRLRADNASLRQDALRYRWLREISYEQNSGGQRMWDMQIFVGPALDTAIDAAMENKS